MEGIPSPKKRRIPKACASCRNSKVKCDGGKPCTRCRNSKIDCDYIRPVLDPVSEKLAQIEQQMQSLSNRVPPEAVTLLQLQQQGSQSVNLLASPYSSDFQQSTTVESPNSFVSSNRPGVVDQDIPFPTFNGQSSRSKRKRGDFEITMDQSLDVVSRGLISHEDALLYFQTFFQGCDKYVPIFSTKYDTFASVRARSNMLFDIICAVGCRAEHGPASSQYQALSNATKSPICDVILGTVPASVETIQALLVNACYSEKGWLLTSMATRMALDLNLPKAVADLSARALSGRQDRSEEKVNGDWEEEQLFGKARVWFGTFVLEHILSLDCGKKPGVTAVDGMRRCRVLLRHPARSSLDLRLLAQVELNSIRALAHDRLSSGSLSDEELTDVVQSTRIDLNIWLNDWIKIVETSTLNENPASLIINLRIQKEWSELTMLCKGLQGMGINNVAIMSDEERSLVHLAKLSAQRHMRIIITNPELYLATFRYGMDFVWAKCAFSVLFLLKLARLLPSATEMPQLISDSKILLSELSKARGSNNIYFRILCLSVEKCERALKEDAGGGTGDALNFPDAEMDFQSYVPKEFTLEWNFPGLTFCWIPFDFQDMFLDFGTGF